MKGGIKSFLSSQEIGVEREQNSSNKNDQVLANITHHYTTLLAISFATKGSVSSWLFLIGLHGSRTFRGQVSPSLEKWGTCDCRTYQCFPQQSCYCTECPSNLYRFFICLMKEVRDYSYRNPSIFLSISISMANFSKDLDPISSPSVFIALIALETIIYTIQVLALSDSSKFSTSTTIYLRFQRPGLAVLFSSLLIFPPFSSGFLLQDRFRYRTVQSAGNSNCQSIFKFIARLSETDTFQFRHLMYLLFLPCRKNILYRIYSRPRQGVDSSYTDLRT